MKPQTLAALRKQRGLTQVEVASALGVSQSAVSKMESGRDVSLAQLRAFVGALGGELEVAARFGDAALPIGTREIRYGERASTRRVAERAVQSTESDSVVAPEWLDEVDRIRSLRPADRLQELANAATFFAVARRCD